MNFISVKDVDSIPKLLDELALCKSNPYQFGHMGLHKTIALVFLNPSLRTRLSTQKAASLLGMQCISFNLDKEGWALETEEGIIMNGNKVEHVKEAAAVIGRYCDVIGLRSFPGLADREADYSEDVFNKFIRYSGKPVLSLESATLHPLQSLADAFTIREQWKSNHKPKIVLTWAPHVKAIPQAVANSFAEWMLASGNELVITHPEGYELHENYTAGAHITHNQSEAIKDADFVYVKNWSAYHDYGRVLSTDPTWMLTHEKLKISNNAKVMHCLPVRRGVELSDEILDGSNSLVLEQAENRVWAAMAILKRMLERSPI